MFELFTFGAHPPSPPLLDDVSPFDTTTPQPTEPTSAPYQLDATHSTPSHLLDVVNKLSQQSLRPSYPYSPPSPNPPAFECEDDQYQRMTLTPSASFPSPPTRLVHCRSLPLTSTCTSRGGRDSIANKRLQRQLNVQLQSCGTHLRNINALVEDMIATSSQCRLHRAAPRPRRAPTSAPREPSQPASSGDDDDDDTEDGPEKLHVFDDAEELESSGAYPSFESDEMTLRRACAPSGIRKLGAGNGARCGARDEYLGLAGRHKTRSFPRMRRRSKGLIKVDL